MLCRVGSAFKAYTLIKEREADYEMHLNKLFMMHNLSNNSGVLSTLKDEANEQVRGEGT